MTKPISGVIPKRRRQTGKPLNKERVREILRDPQHLDDMTARALLLAYRLLGDAEFDGASAEDFVNEAVTKHFLGKRKVYLPKKAQWTDVELVSKYLLYTVRSLISNARERSWRDQPDEDEANFADERSGQVDCEEVVDLAFGGRECKARTAGLLRLEGRSRQEIADALGLSKSTIDKHIAKFKEVMRVFIERAGVEDFSLSSA